MPEVVVLHDGEDPKDPENFVLIEPIPAPRGGPRYRLTAYGANEDGQIGFIDSYDGLELARAWAEHLRRQWRSRPPLYMREPLE